MLFLAAPSAQPDYVALAMVLVLLLAVAVMTVRKYLANKKKSQAAAAEILPETAAPAAVPNVSRPAAPGSAGHIRLHNVEPKTAAMAMAIVADKMGKPLNELRFISIKEVTEE